jgi:hypothetical protein
VGRWKFHNRDGDYKLNRNYDIEIIEKEGVYFVKNLQSVLVSSTDRSVDYNKEPDHVFYATSDILIDDGQITFNATYFRSFTANAGSRDKYEIARENFVYIYQLRLEDGMLKGTAKTIFSLWAFGDSDYRHVLDAIKDGRGKFVGNNNCDNGDCGTENVYFTRQ